MRLAVALAVASISIATPAAADIHDDVLDVLRSAQYIAAQTQEARISEGLTQKARDVEEAIAVAIAMLQANRIRGGAIDVGVVAGGGLDVFRSNLVGPHTRAGADAAAKLSAHLDGDRCRIAFLDALVRGRTATSTDDRARASADGSVGICFPEGLDFTVDDYVFAAFPISLRAHASLNKTPSLAASRALIAEPYSEAGWGVWLEGMRYLRENRSIYYAGPGLTIEQQYHWRGWITGEASRQEILADAYFVRLARRRDPFYLSDRAVDIFGFGFHGVQTDDGVAVGEFWPVRFSGFGLFSDRVLVDLVVGVSVVATLTSDDGTVIDNANVPKRAIGYVRSGLSIGDQALSGGARYDRGLQTNLLEELVQEDRGTLWLKQGRGLLVYSGSLFGARALHFPDKTTRGEERIVGGTFEGSYKLGGGLAAGVNIEAVYSIRRDEVLEGRVVPDGIRAFATVSYTTPIVESQRPAAR